MDDVKDNGYWKGLVDAHLEFNDKEHERIYELLQEFIGHNIDEHRALTNDVINLKVKASIWGAVAGLLVSITGYLGHLFLSTHVTK